MQKFIYLFLAVFFYFLSACEQNHVAPDPTLIIEPVPHKILGRDTIRSGNYAGLTIGSSAAETYQDLKKVNSPTSINYLNLVSNIYTDLNQLRDKLPLYHNMYFSNPEARHAGIQINFEAGKVKSIFTNEGKKLNKWPVGATNVNSVQVNDPVTIIFDKLVKIKAKPQYAKTFSEIMLLTKDPDKAYDNNMSQLPQWYFSYKLEGRKWDEVQLIFKAGKLGSINLTHFESPEK